MKKWIIKVAAAIILSGFLFTGCVEHRHFQRDHDDRADHRGDHRDDHHDDNHHDNDHPDNH